MATASYLVQNTNASSFDKQFLKELDRCMLIKPILCSTVSQLTNIYWISKLYFLLQFSLRPRWSNLPLISQLQKKKKVYIIWKRNCYIWKKGEKIRHLSLQGCNTCWRTSKMYSKVTHAFHIRIPFCWCISSLSLLNQHIKFKLQVEESTDKGYPCKVSTEPGVPLHYFPFILV